MTTVRAVGLPSVVLWVLPPVSVIALLGVITFSKSAILIGLFGALWLVTLFAEVVVFGAIPGRSSATTNGWPTCACRPVH